jgi:hypothetical protein
MGTVECFTIRGSPMRVSVWIDERPGALDELTFYDPIDLARVEVFGGGRMIRVYTTWFMESAARRKYLPMPLTI